MASGLTSKDNLGGKKQRGKDRKAPGVASYMHCMFLPLLSDEVVAKIQSLESYYDVQIGFTEKHISILELSQAVFKIGLDVTTSQISESCSTCFGTDTTASSLLATPTWFCTDLSKPGCAPFQLSPADSESLEKHFLFGGVSVNLSGEGYFIDFTEMKLKSLSGKAGSLQRRPSFDGTPQQKVKVCVQGDLSKSREVHEAVAKVFDESYVKASPLQIVSTLVDSLEVIRNITRQYCIDYEFVRGENGSYFVLLITGAPGYIETVHKKVQDQLMLLKKLLNSSIVPGAEVVPQIANPSLLFSLPGNQLSPVSPMFRNGPSPSSLSKFSSVTNSPGLAKCSTITPATSPNVLQNPKQSPSSHSFGSSFPATSVSPVSAFLSAAVSPGPSNNLTLASSPNAFVVPQSLPPSNMSASSTIGTSAALLTMGALSRSNFNPLSGGTKPASNPIAIPSSSVQPPSPQRSPTLKPTFIESGKVPTLWEPQSEKCVFCDVPSGCKEWNAVLKLATKTLPSINLEKIERVQNMVLWEKYGLEGKHMNERNIGQTNEKYLFHGTSKVDPHDVAKADSGIDFRYSMTNRKSLMWGAGAYFAVNLSYSDHYSYKCLGNKRQVMVVSVLTGCSHPFGTTTSRELTKPPAIPNAKEPRLYDTVNGQTGGSLVYVVYDHCKTCPAYIITYTKR